MLPRLVLVLTLLGVPSILAVPSFPRSTSESVDFPTSGTHGAVATEVAECSDIGVETMKSGGSAADAIIASAFCVGTISAYHSGIGGGGFMLVRYPNGSTHDYEMIDFRETMPAAGNETMYSNNSDPTASTIGGLAVGVPGELRGWETLHARHGKLPWKSLFQPAINLARNGFTVNVDLAAALDEDEYPFLTADPLWAEVYAPNGTLAKEGDTIYRKRYANTLETISEYGADYFYTGDIAINTLEAIYSRNGIMTASDLEGYEAIIREPANITYRNNTRIFSTVAPSSGVVVLSALKIFEGYPGYFQDTDPEINVTTHLLIEADRFGYGQRTEYGDPAFTANVTSLEAEYLTDEVATEIRTKIFANTTFGINYYNPNNYIVLQDHGTSHIAAADDTGMVISLTTTVNLYWGSTIMTTDGVILNDEMDDFSSPGEVNSFGFAASPANYIAGGKRPQSSISSSIAEDLETGEFIIATGSAGGSRIITTTLQHLYHYLDQALTANQSVHHSRWHDQLDGYTYFEWASPQVQVAGYNNETVAYLADMGYNTTYESTTGATGHIVAKKDGVFTAASDPRKAAGKGAAY